MKVPTITKTDVEKRLTAEVHSLLHALWGKAKNSPDYDKDQWLRLQLRIERMKTAVDSLRELADEENWYGDPEDRKWLDPEISWESNEPIRKKAEQYAQDKLKLVLA